MNHSFSNYLFTGHLRLDLIHSYSKGSHCTSISKLINNLRLVKLLVTLGYASFKSHVTASSRINSPTLIPNVCLQLHSSYKQLAPFVVRVLLDFLSRLWTVLNELSRLITVMTTTKVLYCPVFNADSLL